MVLPPGAAQISNAVSPGLSPSKIPGQAAAASWIHHLPSLKPSSDEICPASCNLTVPLGKTIPFNFLAHVFGSSITVKSIAAPRMWAVSNAMTIPFP